MQTNQSEVKAEGVDGGADQVMLLRDSDELFPKRNPLAFSRNLLCSLQALWTVAAILLAGADQSWGALAIAWVFGPSVNALLAVTGIVYLIVRRLVNPAIRIGGTVVWVLIGAALSTVLIYGTIMQMNLHGC